MATIEIMNRGTGDDSETPAFLVLDTESVPDGRLLSLVKYPGEQLRPEEAIARAQAEARERSPEGSDFLPVTFHYPVAVCVLRVGNDFRIQAIKCLDNPLFRPQKMVEEFWRGFNCYKAKLGSRFKLVTFNGRCFDLPLLELAAFRYGYTSTDYFLNSRNRFNGELDLLDWMTNYGAYRLTGGLNLISKLLGKPGKMDVSGDQVYSLYQQGEVRKINEYCMFDTLDTYFVFLRTRVLRGDLSSCKEQDLTLRAKEWLTDKVAELPALQHYLDNWGEGQPWP